MSYPLSLYQPAGRISRHSQDGVQVVNQEIFSTLYKNTEELLFYSCYLKISVASMKTSLCFCSCFHIASPHTQYMRTLSGLIWRSHSRPRRDRPCSPSSPWPRCRSFSCWRWRSGVCFACSRTRWEGASGRPGPRGRRNPPRTGRRTRRSLRLARGRQQTETKNGITHCKEPIPKIWN
jgi:hypothetical protein